MEEEVAASEDLAVEWVVEVEAGLEDLVEDLQGVGVREGVGKNVETTRWDVSVPPLPEGEDQRRGVSKYSFSVFTIWKFFLPLTLPSPLRRGNYEITNQNAAATNTRYTPNAMNVCF